MDDREGEYGPLPPSEEEYCGYSDERIEPAARGEQLRGRRQLQSKKRVIVGPFTANRRASVDVDAEDVEMEDVSGDILNAPPLPSPPVYTGCTLNDRRVFMRDYDAYFRRCRLLSAGKTSTYILPVSACIDDRVRQTIIRFEMRKQVHEVLEQDWLDYFRQANLHGQDHYDALGKALQGLRIDTREKDAISRIARLRQDFLNILDTFNMDKSIDEEPKFLIKHLTNALYPAAFREHISSRLKRETYASYTKDVVLYFAWITEEMASYLQWMPREDSSRNIKQRTTNGSERVKHIRVNDDQRMQHSQSIRERDDRTMQQGRSGNTKYGFRNYRKEENNFPCLKCQSKAHRVNQCPSATAEEAARLLKEWRDKKSMKNGRDTNTKVRSVALDRKVVDTEDGWSDCLIEDQLLVSKALLDSGADVSLASKGVVDTLVNMGVHVKIEEPKQSMILVPVNDNRFIARRKVIFDKVKLFSTAGPVVVRKLECWIHEEDSQHTLTIGRKIMAMLGYSSDALIARARQQKQEYDVELKGVEPSEVAKACRVQTEKLFEEVKTMEYDRFDERVMFPDIKEKPLGLNEEAVEQAVDEAIKSGMPSQYKQRLNSLLTKYSDVFRTSFGQDPPVKVDPLKIRLKPNAEPVKCTARRYPPAHREFLDQHVSELLEHGLVYMNHRSRWCSAPRIVSKKEPGQYRMTIDVRGVNSRTEPMPWPMPILEVVTESVAGSNVYFTLDWFRGYWQLPLHVESQEYFTFMTSRGMVTPTRVLMGCTDAVAFCQGTVEDIFGELLYQGMLAWLDDILGYAKSGEDLFNILESVLKKCLEFGLKLHPDKCQFYRQEATWCGKVISAQGISHCPKRLQGLRDLPSPKTAGDLQQFICAINWMRQSIPRFNELVSPLSTLLEKCMQASKSRKKTQLARLLLNDYGWNELHEQQLELCKQSLMKMVPLAHPRTDRVLCLFTDASVDYWGAAATQTTEEELAKPIEEQVHEPLAFLSGVFTGSSRRWPIIEKEAFAIVESCKRLDYLLLRQQGFRLFTDHRNLVYMFNPRSFNGNMARYQADKLQRWAMALTAYRYEVEHIAGDKNVWGDLLSRWGASMKEESTQSARIRAIVSIPSTQVQQQEEFIWPSVTEIYELQQQAISESSRTNLILDSKRTIYINTEGKIWIPAEAVDLQMRICVIAHAGNSGHRGVDATIQSISEYFIWNTIASDVKSFIASCLHCLSTRGGKEPRPFGPTTRATKPNEVIHFDFLSLPQDTTTKWRYVLVIKDNMSGYVELHGYEQCGAREAVDGLISWFSRYGIVPLWISDQGSHFQNSMMEQLRRVLNTSHHFVTAYCPWSNGTVEVVNRQLLQCMKAILSEKRLKTTQWSSLVPIIQSALNHQPSDRLGGIAPITAFTALPPNRPLRAMFIETRQEQSTELLVIAEIKKHVESTRESIDRMHMEIVGSSDKKRKQARDRHNKKSHIKTPNFTVGDFVLTAKVSNHGNKLAAQWLGPKRIVGACNDLIYEVQDLLPPYRVMKHHASRIKFYCESSREVTEEMLTHLRHSQGTYLVRAFDGFRVKNDGSIEVKVLWEGFSDEEVLGNQRNY